MQTKNKWLLIVLSLCMLLSGCSLSLKLVDPGNATVGFGTAFENADSDVLVPSKPIPSAAQAVMEHMSLRQKVGQLVLVGLESTQQTRDMEMLIKDYQVSGIVLAGHNLAEEAQIATLVHQGNELANASQLALRMPLLWCLAEEGGTRQSLPAAMGRLESAQTIGFQDYIMALQYGERIGAMFQRVGINTLLGPVFDVSGRNTAIGNRAFASDAARVAYYATEAMQGLHNAGIISVAKHFPGSGDASASVYGSFDVVDKNYAQLLGNELLPFVAAFDRNADAVLVSHVLLSQIDPDNPASLSPMVIGDLLRGELGYAGIVISDDVNVDALTSAIAPEQAAVLAIQAGCDMVVVCNSVQTQSSVLDALYQACMDGSISPERLEDAVGKVIALKQSYFLSE